jgi:hypothetical protein
LRCILKGVEEPRLASYRSKTLQKPYQWWRTRTDGSAGYLPSTSASGPSVCSHSSASSVVAQDIRKFNPRCHATFTHITESTAQKQACNLHLTWSKTEEAGGGDIQISRQEAPLDANHAIRKRFIKNRLDAPSPHPVTRPTAWSLTRSRLIL